MAPTASGSSLALCVRILLFYLLSPSIFLHPQLLLARLHHATAAAKSLQSCPTLCDPRHGSPPGSPVPGILQARTLEWAAISFSNAWKWKVKAKVAQPCPTPSDPLDCSIPGSSVHGILQARVLEWGATALSRLHLGNYLPPSLLHCLCFLYILNPPF